MTCTRPWVTVPGHEPEPGEYTRRVPGPGRTLDATRGSGTVVAASATGRGQVPPPAAPTPSGRAPCTAGSWHGTGRHGRNDSESGSWAARGCQFGRRRSSTAAGTGDGYAAAVSRRCCGRGGARSRRACTPQQRADVRIRRCGSGRGCRCGSHVSDAPPARRLLIVHHTRSPALQELLQAVIDGTWAEEIEGVETVVRPALAGRRAGMRRFPLGDTGEHRLHAGAFKHFFDQVDYPYLNAKPYAPCGLRVHHWLCTGPRSWARRFPSVSAPLCSPPRNRSGNATAQ